MTMRTVPKQLAIFRDIVKGHGDKLRSLSWEQIMALANEPTQHIEVESRTATIQRSCSQQVTSCEW